MNGRRVDRLLTLISEGSNSAFEKLYIETRKGVFSFLYSYLHNYSDAEDAMQTVYIKIKQNISSYTKGSNGSAWILQIAKNYALNIVESRKRRAELSLDKVVIPIEDKIEGELGITELMQRVLTEEEQRIVTLHVLWSYKHKEIAQILGCPTGTITSKYKRAVEKLKKEFKG